MSEHSDWRRRAELLLLRLQCAGEPKLDRPWFAFQHRPELIMLVEWMKKHDIRSYLELGVYRGGLASVLQELFRFEKIAGADAGVIQKERKLEVSLPKAMRMCWAETESSEYRRFRHAMGKMELVFIDADHSYGAVRKDFERERRQPHRFLAFHDIKNETHAPGVVRLWNELGGKKRELYVERTDGEQMGIGLWSEKERP